MLADTSPAHSALKAAATRSSRPAPAAVHRGDPILMAASVSASARSWRPERVSPRARSGQERGVWSATASYCSGETGWKEWRTCRGVAGGLEWYLISKLCN